MPETETSPSDTIQRFVGVIVRGRWFILLTTFVVTLVAVAALYRIPNSYTSEATLLVVPQQVPARYVTPTSETNIADALQTMTQDVLSRGRLLELIDQFGLYAKQRQHLAPEETVELMRTNIHIDPIDPTPGRKEISAFKISFVAEKATLAQEVTSKLTSFFIQVNLKTREDQATNTANFLRAQGDAAKDRLTEQEERVRDFKTQYLGELPEQQQGNLAILSGAQLQLQNIDASLDRAQQQRAYLESFLGASQRLASRGVPVSTSAARAETRVVDPIQTLQGDLTTLQAQRTQLLNAHDEKYPEVKAIDREISAKQALLESFKSAKVAAVAPSQASPAASPDKGQSSPPAGQSGKPPAESEEDASIAQVRGQMEANRLEIENLTKDETQQKAVIEQYQKRLNLTPVREQQLAGILRDYELSRTDYLDLLGKEQQSQLAMSMEKQQGGQQFRLVEPPSLPAIPSSPKRVKLGLGGFGAGLFLGLVAAFLKELAGPTFHTTREISQKFGAPLVVGLPVIFTQADGRRRTWRKTFEWLSGSVVALAICAAELYVLQHP